MKRLLGAALAACPSLLLAQAPADTGLAQALRQQLASECYGFVEHDTEQIRGFRVDGRFQVTRDGYPWPRFDPEAVANLLVARTEALVGGPGLGCGWVQPGGTINQITRRFAQSPARALIDVDSFGLAGARLEQRIEAGRLSAWTALRRERARDQAGDTFQSGEFAGLFDFALSDRTRLRLDLELARGFGDGQAGWPAFTSLPSRFNRRITTAQRGWAGYRVNSDSALLAIEHAVSDRTLVRLGHSIIRYKGSWTDLFLDPVAGPSAGGVPQYTLTGFVNRDQDFASNAWHGDITTRWQWAGAQHRSIAALTQIDTNEPDRLWPGQTVGLWTLGTQLPAIALLPATAQRRLVSNETRLTLRNTAQWKALEVGLGLQIAKFEDATREFIGPGAALGQVSRTLVLPAITARYALSESVSVVATHSRGGTGRQFASINSTTPGQILPAVVSEESELGARWSHGPWSIGMALFQISRPYRFEQQNISVWRGLQAHEGVEATVQWRSEDELTSVAFTAQSLRAAIQGTGDPTLDGKLPPGLPRHRATWFAEHRLGKDSDWTLNFAGEARSKAATFDDNEVFADGFVRLDAGLLRRISSIKRSPTLQLNVENLTNRFAWADIGGGIVFPLPRRRVFMTLTVPLQ